MHFVTAKSILSAKNGTNLYRGCLHGCIYCDSRSNCYNMQHKFEDIEIKANVVELLEKAFKSKRKKCMIGMGSMTDPYIPLEKEIQSTRKNIGINIQIWFWCDAHNKISIRFKRFRYSKRNKQ